MDNYRIMWTEQLLTGCERIDVQHKKLIQLIENVSETTDDGDVDLLDGVLRYADEHFGDEEAFMASIDYPGLEAQRREHKKGARIIEAYKRKYEEGETDLYLFKQFMFRWVRDHIMDEDKEIAAFVRSKANQVGDSEEDA